MEIKAKYRQKGYSEPITASIRAMKSDSGQFLQVKRRNGELPDNYWYETEIAQLHEGAIRGDGTFVFMGVHTNTLFYIAPIFCRRAGLNL